MEYHDLPTKGNIQYDDRTIPNCSPVAELHNTLNQCADYIMQLRKENDFLREQLEQVRTMINTFGKDML